jgi:hypothetical protein
MISDSYMLWVPTKKSRDNLSRIRFFEDYFNSNLKVFVIPKMVAIASEAHKNDA